MDNRMTSPGFTIWASSIGNDGFRRSCIVAANALGIADGDANLGTDIAIAAGRGEHRVYHDVEHFENLVGGVSDLLVALGRAQLSIGEAFAQRLSHLYIIAARDHDVAYVAVDQGMIAPVQNAIDPYIEKTEEGAYRIRKGVEGENIRIAMAAFGYQPGQMLAPFNGQNEFISALYSLEINKGLTMADKLPLALMLYATVPFQPAEAIAQSIERLQPFQSLNAEEVRALGMSAAHLSNCDVVNFGEDRAIFFNSTIKLMQEGGTNFSDPAHIAEKSLRQVQFFSGLLEDVDAGKKTIFRNDGDLMPSEQFEEQTAKARAQIVQCIVDMKAVAVAADSSKAHQVASELGLDLSNMTPQDTAYGNRLLQQAYQQIRGRAVPVVALPGVGLER